MLQIVQECATLLFPEVLKQGVAMKRDELIRQLRKDAKAAGLELIVEQVRGKGSHDVVRLGARFTVIQSGEISPLMERTIRRQLGL